MGKKSIADASLEELKPTEVQVIGPNVQLTASLLEILKTASKTQRK